MILVSLPLSLANLPTPRPTRSPGWAASWIGGRWLSGCPLLSHVRNGFPPILMIHGDADDIVQFDHAVRLRQALDEAGVLTKLHAIEGAGMAVIPIGSPWGLIGPYANFWLSMGQLDHF